MNLLPPKNQKTKKILVVAESGLLTEVCRVAPLKCLHLVEKLLEQAGSLFYARFTNRCTACCDSSVS